MRRATCLSFPKIISGRICDAAQPRSELRQWRQIVGLLDARAHLSLMPNAYALGIRESCPVDIMSMTNGASRSASHPASGFAALSLSWGGKRALAGGC